MSEQGNARAPARTRFWLRRRYWENGATALIALGVIMLMQPLWLTLYTYSFLTLLAGTALFTVASKLPE